MSLGEIVTYDVYRTVVTATTLRHVADELVRMLGLAEVDAMEVLLAILLAMLLAMLVPGDDIAGEDGPADAEDDPAGEDPPDDDCDMLRDMLSDDTDAVTVTVDAVPDANETVGST